MSEADIKAAMADGSLYTSATLTRAVLAIDPSHLLTLIPGKDREHAIATASHELGHADSAARDPLAHFRRSLPINQTDGHGNRLSHDDREVEKIANEYKKRVAKDF